MSDIATVSDEVPKWDPANSEQSLRNIFCYVVEQAGESSRWYWRAKIWKARVSQAIRLLAWVLAAIGGLLPIIGALLPGESGHNLGNGLWASLLLGIAAALLGLDKAFGYSSGWARYVLTATNIRKALEEFRLDWTELMTKTGPSPTPEQVAPLIERARRFRVDVEGLVLQETKDWVAEFQSSMAQMEKEVAAQLSSLKAQVDKAVQARQAADQPGSIQLTIPNSNKASAGSMKVSLTDSASQTIQEAVTGSSWSRINVAAGQYQLKLDATINAQPIQEQRVVIVRGGGQTESLQISL